MSQVNLEIGLNTKKKIKTKKNITEYFDEYIKQFRPYKNNPVYRAFMSFILDNYIDLIYDVQPDKLKQLFEDQIIASDMVDTLLVSIGLPQALINELTIASKIIILRSMADFERYKGTVKMIKTIGGSFSDMISYYELYIDYKGDFINTPGEYLITIQKNNIPNNSYFILNSPEKKYYVWFNWDKKGIDPKNKTASINDDGVVFNIDNSNISNNTSIDLSKMTGIEIKVNSKLDDSKTITKKLVDKLNKIDDFIVTINTSDLLDVEMAKSGYTTGFSKGTTKLSYVTLHEPKNTGSWILRPKCIYHHPNMEINENYIPYDEAYNSIPELLISEEQLTQLKEKDQIVLPIKSNILLMNYSEEIKPTSMNTLYFTIIINSIGERYLSLFLSDSDHVYSVTYRTIIYYWYYLIQRYYNTTLQGISAREFLVMGSGSKTKYKITDLPTIDNEYNNIKSNIELNDFYNKYLCEDFFDIYEAETPKLSELKKSAKFLNKELFEYVENRINSAKDQKIEIQTLLDEIYYSINAALEQFAKSESAEDQIIAKYKYVILGNLSSISATIEKTDPYKIVYYLKPYHTSLLSISMDKVTVNNKFEALLFDDTMYSLFDYVCVSAMRLSDQINVIVPISGKTGSGNSQDSLSIISFIQRFMMNYPFTTPLNMKDSWRAITTIFFKEYGLEVDLDNLLHDFYYYYYIHSDSLKPEDQLGDFAGKFVFKDKYEITDDFTVTVKDVPAGWGQLYGKYWDGKKDPNKIWKIYIDSDNIEDWNNYLAKHK